MQTQLRSKLDNRARVNRLAERSAAPTLPTTPLLTSAGSGWRNLLLEHHRMVPGGELTGTVEGYQVCMVVRGSTTARWKVAGRELCETISPRHIGTATHGEFRSLSWTSPFEILLYSISPKIMADLCEDLGRGRTVELVKQHSLRDPYIETILLMLRADVAGGNLCGSVFGEQLGLALASYLYSRYSASNPKSPTVSRLPGLTLQKVLSYIDERLAGPISVQELAECSKISRFYFARLFRNSVGQSPAHYILERRLEKAKSLLAKKHTRMREVSKACGFLSQSHFATAFRSQIGVSPSEYKRLIP